MIESLFVLEGGGLVKGEKNKEIKILAEVAGQMVSFPKKGR